MLRGHLCEGKDVMIQGRASQRLDDDALQHRPIRPRMETATANDQPRAGALAHTRLDERPQLPTSSLGMKLMQVAAGIETEAAVAEVRDRLFGDSKCGPHRTVESRFHLQRQGSSCLGDGLRLGWRCWPGLEVDRGNPIRAPVPRAYTGQLSLEEPAILLVRRPPTGPRAVGWVTGRHRSDSSALEASRWSPPI